MIDNDGGALLCNGMAVGSDGTLYAASGNPNDGIRRSLDPTTAAPTNPTFESMDNVQAVSFKLPAGATLANLVLLEGSNVLYTVDNTGQKLLGITDTLTAGPALSSPAWKAASPTAKYGTAEEVIPVLTTTTTGSLTWNAVTGATNYQQVVTPAGATVAYTAGKTTASLTTLAPGTTYTWKVRANAPVLSRYSDNWKFTTALGTPAVVEAFTPTKGATNVSVTPVLSWPSVAGATGYNFILSEDPDFEIIEYSVTEDYNFHRITDALKYSSTYYWKVRAIGEPASASSAAVAGAWVTGHFTTEAEPVAPTFICPQCGLSFDAETALKEHFDEAHPPAEPSVVTEPGEVKIVEVPISAPPEAIPTPLLWAIIGIGAVLIIALIVLIVRTRRVV
jgi:hypothetical protein